MAALADRLAADPMAFAFSDPGPAQGAALARSVARDLATLAGLSASDGMLSLLPHGLARDFSVSRLHAACPTP